MVSNSIGFDQLADDCVGVSVWSAGRAQRAKIWPCGHHRDGMCVCVSVHVCVPFCG